mmetsp:Transcript_34617/g.68140  ORF Transcript_34617/g.68140 Transcript_34617/m.68140 type:complete len:224 (-) Transcript_34617:1138-1809(-)
MFCGYFNDMPSAPHKRTLYVMRYVGRHHHTGRGECRCGDDGGGFPCASCPVRHFSAVPHQRVSHFPPRQRPERLALLLNGRVRSAEILKVGHKEVEAAREIGYSHGFPAGMHGQLGHPHVHGPYSRGGANNRPDRTPAPAVVPDHKLLGSPQPRPPRHLPHQQPRDPVGRVLLVAVPFDDDAPVHRRHVRRLVLLGVVRVHRVCLIHAQDEALAEGRSGQIGV